MSEQRTSKAIDHLACAILFVGLVYTGFAFNAWHWWLVGVAVYGFLRFIGFPFVQTKAIKFRWGTFWIGDKPAELEKEGLR